MPFFFLAHLALACGSSSETSTPSAAPPASMPRGSDTLAGDDAGAAAPVDPVLVTNDLQDAADAVFHDGFVYVAEERNGLVRVDASGKIESIVGPDDEIDFVTVAGDALFWTAVSSSIKLMTAPLSDLHAARSITTFGTEDGAIAIRGTSVVYSSFVPGAVQYSGYFELHRFDLATPSTRVKIADDVATWDGSADDADAYYIGLPASTVVARVPIASGNPRKLTVVSDEGSALKITVAGSNVFFQTSFGLDVMPKSGGKPNLVFPGKLTALTAGTSAVYWTIEGGVGTKVFRCDADGTNARFVGELPATSPILVPADADLFVLDRSALYRFPHG